MTSPDVDLSTLPPPPSSSPPPRVLSRRWRAAAWASYFVGEIVVLAALWATGEVGFDLKEQPAQVNDWRRDPLVLTVLIILGLAALGGGLLVRARRGGLSRSWWLASACAGLLAVAGGVVAMATSGSYYCYIRPAPPGSPQVRKPCATGLVDPLFSDYIALYRQLAWVVIGAGITMLVLSGLIWFVHGRRARCPEGAGASGRSEGEAPPGSRRSGAGVRRA